MSSGCVLPVAPEFQDPPAAQNYPPIFIDADPPIGASVTGSPTVPSHFRVVVRDPNNDDLYVRWVADYPPYSQDTRPFLLMQIPHPVMAQDVDIAADPDCSLSGLSSQLSYHRIQLIVADGPFVPSEKQPPDQPVDLGLVDGNRYAVRASWILNVKCNP